MVWSDNEALASRRLARLYRRLVLVLAVPTALADCGDGGNAVAPSPADPTVDVSATDGPALLAAASLDRIGFTTVTSGGSDIWSMGPTGANQKRLTSFAGEELEPVWAPDHGRIAFSRTRGSTGLEPYLINADGTGGHWALSTVTGYSITTPSWAPDGKSLVAQIWLSGGSRIAKIDLVTGQWSHLTPAGYYTLSGRNPIYSKDGSWIYYLTSPGTQLRRFQPLGQDVLVKTFPSAVTRLALSPDGTRLAYLSHETGDNEIYVLTLASGQIKRLTYDIHSDTDPAWSQDGAKIAFVSDRAGQPQIYTMNSATGAGVTKLTSKTHGANHPTWYR